MALERLFNNPASGVRSKSLGVSRILTLLTDGKTNVDLDVVRKPADALRRENVEIFAVGIGTGVKLSELKAIANDPDTDYLFLSDSFHAIKKVVPELQISSCSGKYSSFQRRR
jgi:hypothetical protein